MSGFTRFWGRGCPPPRLPSGAWREYAGRVVTDLAEVRRLGEAKAVENLDFRRYLSSHRHPEGPLRVLVGEIERKIDCTACANCCRYSVVAVSREEIETIAEHLGTTPEEVARQHTESDPEAPETRVLRSEKDGCVFLSGNLCTIYEARPRACREFPRIARGRRSLAGRFSSLSRWVPLCPIVYNFFEEYKKLVGYRPLARLH
jgi:uncharacterized protein